MKWTRKVPTVPGAYWLLQNMDGKPELVELDRLGEWWNFGEDEAIPYFDPWEAFYGPVDPPKTPVLGDEWIDGEAEPRP